jgi:alpha-1,6-mannosyltransferase
MNNSIINNYLKNQKILYAAAVAASLVYCIAMTSMGITKFYSVLQGGENYHDFPTHGVSLIRVIINGSYLIATVTYIIWLIQKKPISSSFLDICKYAIPFLALALIAYPYSSDIYLYLHYGVMSLHKINPYLNSSNSFVSNLSPFLHWLQTCTYGPVSLFFFALSALAVPISPLLAVYLFKIICVLVHTLNAYLIWRLLTNSQNRNLITIAYLVNPMLLHEQIANAHLDVLVANTLIILIGCIYYQRYVFGILAIWVGFLVKTLPIIWLPLVFAFLCKQRRWRDLAASVLISLLIVAVIAYRFKPTVSAWIGVLSPATAEATARSFHHAIHFLFINFLPTVSVEARENILSLFKYFAYLSWIVYYAGTLIKSYFRKNDSEINLVSDIGWTTLTLLLCATPWLMSWYPSILLPIAALSINSPHFVLTSLIFSLSPTIILGTGSGTTMISLVTIFVSVFLPTAWLIFGRRGALF